MTLSNAFISLNDVINNFLISYTGPGKLIPDAKRTEVVFHARRCLQEFAYETLKSQFSELGEIVSNSIPPGTQGEYFYPTDLVVTIQLLLTSVIPTQVLVEVSSPIGLSPGQYYKDTANGRFLFATSRVGYDIELKYLSNGLTTDEAAAIPKLAEQALYSCMIYAILANRENTDANTLQRLLMEKEAMLEKSKSRLVFTSFTS